MPRSLQEVFVERDQHTCLWGTFSILSHGEYANDSHGYHIPMDKSVDQTY